MLRLGVFFPFEIISGKVFVLADFISLGVGIRCTCLLPDGDRHSASTRRVQLLQTSAFCSCRSGGYSG